MTSLRTLGFAALATMAIESASSQETTLQGKILEKRIEAEDTIIKPYTGATIYATPIGIFGDPIEGYMREQVIDAEGNFQFTNIFPWGGSTSSKGEEASGYSVRPHPVHEQGTITLPETTKGTYSIIDMESKIVAQGNIGDGQIHTLPKTGMYVFRHQNHQGTSNHKLMTTSQNAQITINAEEQDIELKTGLSGTTIYRIDIHPLYDRTKWASSYDIKIQNHQTNERVDTISSQKFLESIVYLTLTDSAGTSIPDAEVTIKEQGKPQTEQNAEYLSSIDAFMARCGDIQIYPQYTNGLGHTPKQIVITATHPSFVTDSIIEGINPLRNYLDMQLEKK